MANNTGSIVEFQTFQPSIEGPGRTRDVGLQSQTEENYQPGAIVDEAAGNPHYFIPQPNPKIISQLTPVVVPATTDRQAFNLPSRDLDWIAFYTPTAPGATLSVGPNAPIIQITQSGWLVLPVSTSQYLFANTNAAPYTLYIMYGRGYPPPQNWKV